ncbi:MAG: flagellar assembly protein FliH [Bacillota bacterium]|nr:flagellar assembly protein FliH [Bacillota bacterium]
MSSIWKRPDLSQPVVLAVGIAAAEEKREPGRMSAACSECRARLMAVLESNLLAAARLRAAAVEKEAAQRAEALLEEARRQAEEIKAAAKAAGHKEGFQAGYAEGREAAENLVREAQACREEAEREREALWAALQPQAIELAFTLARLILRREVRRAPEDVEELLAAAAGKLPAGAAVTVEIAPGERQAWEVARAQIEKALGDRPYVLVESANVPPGQFLITSEMGTVDARFESQLAACAKEVRAVGEMGHAAK